MSEKKLEFVVGRKYLTRDGEVVECISVTESVCGGKFPIKLKLKTDGVLHCMSDGRYYETDIPVNADIVAEHTEPTALEPTESPVVPQSEPEPAKPKLNCDAIYDIAMTTSRLATMSKAALKDLASCTSDSNGYCCLRAAEETADMEGRDSPTRQDYIYAIMYSIIANKYGDGE